MLRIAVCDDDYKVLERLNVIINNYAIKYNISLNVKTFCNGEMLLQNYLKYDIVFLDIEMPGINGIKIADEIRKIDLNVPIVYITSYSDYWRRAYKVHAFDFILKPFESADIYNVLSDFLASLSDADEKAVEFITENGIEVQKLNEIYYFLVQKKKKILIATLYKQYIIKENLVDIFSKLNDDRFYMTHRSCIVNFKYVDTLKEDGGILMTNGEWVPLAQKKQKDFFIQLSNYLRK